MVEIKNDQQSLNEGKHETHNAMTISVALCTYLATLGADTNIYMWSGILVAICYLATISVYSRYNIKKMLLGFKRKPVPPKEFTPEPSTLFGDKPIPPEPRLLKEDEQPKELKK